MVGNLQWIANRVDNYLLNREPQKIETEDENPDNSDEPFHTSPVPETEPEKKKSSWWSRVWK